MSAEIIYDFEGILEPAFSAALQASIPGVITYDSTSDAEFQKDRGRVEIMLQAGGGLLRFRPVNGDQRETAWDATLTLAILTDSDPLVHRKLRAQVRAAMASPAIIGAVNEILLPRHSLGFIRDSGSSLTLRDDENWRKTVLQYQIRFSVQADAWADLAS